MAAWTEPLPSSFWKDERVILKWYALLQWHSSAGYIASRGTTNGSVDKRTIGFIIYHMNQHTKHIILKGEHILLLLDDNKSRNGFEWLESARDSRIEVVQSPANIAHKLQASDDTNNKTFKKGVRDARDEISQKSLVIFGDMHHKLMLGVAWFRALDRNILCDAFVNVGLWPLDYLFLNLFDKKNQTEENAKWSISGPDLLY